MNRAMTGEALAAAALEPGRRAVPVARARPGDRARLHRRAGGRAAASGRSREPARQAMPCASAPAARPCEDCARPCGFAAAEDPIRPGDVLWSAPGRPIAPADRGGGATGFVHAHAGLRPGRVVAGRRSLAGDRPLAAGPPIEELNGHNRFFRDRNAGRRSARRRDRRAGRPPGRHRDPRQPEARRAAAQGTGDHDLELRRTVAAPFRADAGARHDHLGNRPASSAATTQGGGKGKPKVTTYSYTASFAVALASRPIAGIGRIWADGNLLRGAAGDLKTGGHDAHPYRRTRPAAPTR